MMSAVQAALGTNEVNAQWALFAQRQPLVQVAPYQGLTAIKIP